MATNPSRRVACKGQCTFIYDSSQPVGQEWDNISPCALGCTCADDPNAMQQPGQDGDIFVTPCVSRRPKKPKNKTAK